MENNDFKLKDYFISQATKGSTDSFPQKSVLGFYFHLPFCAHLCPYCDFRKTAKFNLHDVDAYFEALEKQLDDFLSIIPTNLYSHVTVYFGGGTPGLFRGNRFAPLMKKIQENFVVEEATLEMNPLKNRGEIIDEYQQIGINRLTLGAQSLCPQTLKVLGRVHTKEMVEKSIREIRSRGIEELQVDFIYGLKKGISTIPIEEQIERSIELGATGISAYALSIEERTLFKGKDFASDDEASFEYEKILKIVEKYSFRQLETSNFGLYESKHNNLYWHGHPYIGLGTGAHGLLPPSKNNPFGRRYFIGPENVNEKSPGNDDLPYHQEKKCQELFALHFEDERTREDYFSEMILLLLRTEKGITKNLAKEIWGKSYEEFLMKNPKLYQAKEKGMVVFDTYGIKIPGSAQFLSDFVILELQSMLN